MHRLKLDFSGPFSLDLTLSCGQVFRWSYEGGWWKGVVGGMRIKVRQEGDCLLFQGADRRFIREYFSLEQDLPSILFSIDRDTVIHEAIGRCMGLRLVRQPAWECLASYICATYANIPGIMRRISLLCERFGDRKKAGKEEFFTFPSAETLASADACRVRECRLGYRAPYLMETARDIAGDPGWEDRIRELPYGEARRELLTLKGVGKKVADCVLLFAFQKYEAFPVDVWIARIMEAHYEKGEALRTYDRISGFGREYFGEFAGYAQEYLYCNRNRIMKGTG